MKKPLMSLFVVCGLAACTSTATTSDPVLPIGSSHAKLAGTSWSWPTELASDPYINFLENGHIRGNSGCNSISGVYEETGDIKYGKHIFRLGDIISTEMACPASMDTEGAFLKALRFTDSYNLSSEHLMFYDEDGTLIIRLDRKNN